MTTVIARSAATTVAVIAIWSFLANRNPESTYHFAPFLAALAGPWLVQSTLGRQPSRVAASTTVISALLVLGAGFALNFADRLLGPTFWGDGGAIAEVVIFTLIGALAGWFVLGPKPALRFDDAQ